MTEDQVAGWLVLSLITASCFGWIANIVKLAWLLDDPLSGWFIFRTIAIFVAPIGAVLGYI